MANTREMLANMAICCAAMMALMMLGGLPFFRGLNTIAGVFALGFGAAAAYYYVAFNPDDDLETPEDVEKVPLHSGAIVYMLRQPGGARRGLSTLDHRGDPLVGRHVRSKNSHGCICQRRCPPSRRSRSLANGSGLLQSQNL